MMIPLLLGAFSLAASIPTVDEGIRRVHSHLLLDDPGAALREAEGLSSRFPQSKEAAGVLVEALSAAGLEESALAQWTTLSARYPDLIADRNLLEEMSWGVLKKGLQSNQHGIRLSSLIGIYLTRDVRAVPVLVKMMRDSNAIVRSVAVQMAGDYGDAPLRDEVARIMAEEKVWMVRIQAMQTAGRLRMKNVAPQLQLLVQSEKTMAEERQVAISALLNIWEEASPEEIRKLAQSNRAGLRHLACAIATHFQVKEVRSEILTLLSDTNSDVRVAALNALGLCYKEMMNPAEIRDALKPRLEENDPAVAITAAWVVTLFDPLLGTKAFTKWLQDPMAENRRLAAAALAATGDRGATLAAQTLQTSSDPYVRANVSFGLIGQRQEVKAACDCLYEFLTQEKRMWMWDSRQNALFQVLAPSQVRYVDQVPNYPESIDQMTRLQLVSMLAVVGDVRAIDALKNFLEKRKWSITGVAAATLLQEGDETSLEVVRKLLEDPSPHIRLQACLVLAMYGKDETVLKELQGAYPGADFECKLHILEALGNVGSQESFSFLVGVLHEPFPLLRVAAAAALIQGLNR
ncbi:MAG TPA: HEAT repeat domain-containing protein [Chlamydiales bacterium]|jgi:HEAT repeat protein